MRITIPTLMFELDGELTTVDAHMPLSAAIESRTMTGIVAPYGQYGMTSAGKVKFLPGSIQLPDDLSRVKLLTHHSDSPGTPPESVGHAIAAHDTPAGLVMTFKIVSTQLGDDALAAAIERAKDSFSVELIQVDLHRDEVRSGYLTAVAQVPIPAFADAQVTSVAASQHPMTRTQEEDTMKISPEQRARLAELLARTDQLTDTELTEMTSLISLANGDTDQSAEPAQAVAVETETTAPAVTPTPADAPAAAVAAAHAPATLAATAANTERSLVAGMRADGLFQMIARAANGERSRELSAALADVAYSGSPFAEQPEYVGELWSGAEFERRYVPLLDTSKPLTSLKVKGWRWVVGPEVDDWAGDKTDVPSNEVEWAEDEFTASRLAGAHDIAREWWDFGNVEAIRAFFAAQAVDYKRKTDMKALAAIIANATGTTALGAAGDVLRAAAVAAAEVEEYTDGVAATYILVNPADKLSLLDINSQEVSAFLRDILNIEPGNFKTAASVPVGTVIAGTRKAIKFRELPGVPIRVTAENIAQGGRDSGLFGYWLAQPEFPNGVRRVRFGA